MRRLTPAAEKAFNLLPTDVGQSLEHIKFSLAVDDIAAIIDEVIESVQPWERDVRDSDGRWWVLRVLPFRTADSRIDGATIVAVDIDLIRQSHELMEARDAALAIVQAVREPLVVLDGDCHVGLANDAFHALLGQTAEQIEGKVLWDIGHGIWQSADLRRAMKNACLGKSQLVNVELERVLNGRQRTLVLNTRAITRTMVRRSSSWPWKM